MPRPRRRSRTTLSLFPFLSVLACIIGTLTLLITATAIGEMGSSALDLESFEALEAEIARGRSQLAELRALGEEIADLDALLPGLRAARQGLASEHEVLALALARSEPLRRQLEEREAHVAGLRVDLEAATREQAELEERLRERESALARAPIGLEPAGSGTGLEPHFVECRDEGVVLYVGPQRAPTPVPLAKLAASFEVRAFLRRVRSQPGATAVLLNRPSGIAACRAFEIEASRRRVRHGRMPIPETGALDFSALDAGEG